MIKRILLILLIGVLLSPALAVTNQSEPQGYFYYWITGKLDASLGAKYIDNRIVVLTKGSQKVTAVTDSAGEFMINAFDLQPLSAEQKAQTQLPISVGDSTILCAVEQGLDGYGADPVAVTISGDGYETVNPKLEKGKGPKGEGQVILSIERSGTDVKVSWKLNTQKFFGISGYSVNIFVYRGDGSGQYTENVTAWSNSPIILNDTKNDSTVSNVIKDPQKDEGSFVYTELYPKKYPEVYFKGLLGNVGPVLGPGITNLVSDEVYGFPGAQAVGKIDYEFKKGKFKLINIPLVLTQSKVSQAIGNQLSQAQLQYNSGGLKQIVLKNGTWDSDIPLAPATGYWLKSVDKDVTCIFVGKVMSSPLKKSLKVGWDLYGYPSPVKQTSSLAAITPADGDKLQFVKGGGLVQYSYKGKWDGAYTLGARDGFWYNNTKTNRYFQVSP